jgi:uncharacterized protein YceK
MTSNSLRHNWRPHGESNPGYCLVGKSTESAGDFQSGPDALGGKSASFCFTRLFALGVVLALLSGCASVARWHEAQWPRPKIQYFHASTAKQADDYAKAWNAAHSSNFTGTILGTGSMEPWLRKGVTRWVLLRRVPSDRIWTKDDIGLVVAFKRPAVRRLVRNSWWSAPAMEPVTLARDVIHMIVDVAPDGRAILTSGTATRSSDGWQRDPVVHGVLCEVVTLQPGSFRVTEVTP